MLGAAVVEIGEPYSDSIADGPTIQHSFHAALERGHRLEDTFEMVSHIRDSVSCGLVSMVSYSVVHRIGVDRFVHDAATAGFDGVIFPDVPVEESRECASAAGDAGLCYVGLTAPTTTPARVAAIAESSTGFIYQIAASGTTGERVAIWSDLGAAVARIREHSDKPVCVGFGVSTADHVREVCKVADGVIVGSALVRRIGEALKRGGSANIIDELGSFLADLSSGLTAAA
jgi:tryptophan synthase alpha chain